MDNSEKVKIAVKAIDSKKGTDIEVIDISEQSVLGDYLVVATGSSTTQVKSLADEVEFKLKEAGVEPHHIEGRSTKWYLLDYGDVMVHIFHTEARNFYALERLWSDGTKLDVAELLK